MVSACQNCSQFYVIKVFNTGIQIHFGHKSNFDSLYSWWLNKIKIKSFIILAVLHRRVYRVNEAHLRIIAPRQHSFFQRNMQRRRAIGNTVYDLTGPRFEPQTSRSRDKRVTKNKHKTKSTPAGCFTLEKGLQKKKSVYENNAGTSKKHSVLCRVLYLHDALWVHDAPKKNREVYQF